MTESGPLTRTPVPFFVDQQDEPSEKQGSTQASTHCWYHICRARQNQTVHKVCDIISYYLMSDSWLMTHFMISIASRWHYCLTKHSILTQSLLHTATTFGVKVLVSEPLLSIFITPHSDIRNHVTATTGVHAWSLSFLLWSSLRCIVHYQGMPLTTLISVFPETLKPATGKNPWFRVSVLQVKLSLQSLKLVNLVLSNLLWYAVCMFIV